MSTGIPNQTPAQQAYLATGSNGTNPSDLGIESSDFITSAGAELSAHQKVLVGSVLDVRSPSYIISHCLSSLLFPPLLLRSV